MPVEIKELVIRAAISESPSIQDQVMNPTKPPGDKTRQLQKILDEVLRKIKSKNER